MKIKILTFTCACLLTLWGSSLWAAQARKEAPSEVRAQVMEKTVKADKVLLGLRWIGAPPAGAAGAEGRVLVLFKAGAGGRPDLADPANQKILAALGPEPGDILVLKILYGPKGWQAREVRFAASDAAVSFPGREKIAPGLVAGLLAPDSTLPVIATLNTNATGKKLQEIVKKLLRGLPRGSFEPGAKHG